MQPTRDTAWALLTEFTDNPSLIKHALSVEVAMRAYARRLGGDEESWGVIGLIHDFDYQQNQMSTVTDDTGLQGLLGLSAAQIQALITHVDNQMKATSGSGGLPSGFEMDLGDLNGDGTGNGSSSGLPAAKHLGQP